MSKHKSFFKTSAAAIGLLHCVNKYISSSVTANSNGKVSGHYYHWKQGNLFYRKYGNGSPLLLLHDLSVISSGYEWSGIIPSLSSNHTVYMLDLIGCGKSDKPLITYTCYYYVQMIRDFIQDVIGEKTDVVAAGLSSCFVFSANNMNKDLFGDIVLLNPKNVQDLKTMPDNCSKALMKLFRLPVLGKAVYYLLTNKNNIESCLTEKYFYSPFKLNSSITNASYLAAHTANGNGRMLFASLRGNYLNMDISQSVSNAKNRITLILGDQIKNKEEISASYLKLNRNILVLSVPKTKYLPQLEAPEETARLLSLIINQTNSH